MDIELLKEFVKEVLSVCYYDAEGITYGLEDKALQVGAELGMSKEDMTGEEQK